MITPIRGRKRKRQWKQAQAVSPIRNDNPDKGTETGKHSCVRPFQTAIRNDNPDKGTETISGFSANILCSFLIRNDNPDKGTETREVFLSFSRSLIRNDNPDKGTETNPRVDAPWILI